MNIFFAANIKLLRKRRGRTQDDVAVATNIKRPTLSGYENSGVFPSIEALIVLSNYFKVAIDTLLKVDLGKISEFQLSELERGNDVFIRGSNIRVLATTVNTIEEENIELVPEKAKAGYSTGYADPEYISDLPKFQLPFLSKNKKFRTFQITGDSMLPIPEGSWVTGEFVQDWHTINSGKPYIIMTLEDGIVFKIADNLIQDEGKLRLYSLNPLYKPYDVAVVDIKEVWCFSHFICSEIPEAGNSGNHLTQKVFELSREIEAIKDRLNENKG
jgi:transcriptional regulator with XRE-family HTH domain